MNHWEYATLVDETLSAYCEELGVEYSTLHDEAFCVKLGGWWHYIWYDTNCEQMNYSQELDRLILKHINSEETK